MCAQLCGVGHYRMRGFINVMSKKDYQQWMDKKIEEQLAESSESSEEDDFWG